MASVNPSNKRRERQLILALQDRLSAQLERELAKLLAATYRAAANRFEATGELASIDAAVNARADDLRKILAAGSARSATTFAQRLTDNARKSQNRFHVIHKASLRQRVTQTIVDFVKEHTAKRVVQVNDTTKDHIKNAVRRGREASQSVTEIAQTIRAASQITTTLRAHTIARTETHTAANVGAMAAAEDLNIPLTKEWVSSGDDRTRPDHEEANGQVVELDESFTVGGERLKFPGDPDGSAENIINCRCAVVFNA